MKAKKSQKIYRTSAKVCQWMIVAPFNKYLTDMETVGDEYWLYAIFDGWAIWIFLYDNYY
jgi:hypothetical protein